jgi:hypothetical protein
MKLDKPVLMRRAATLERDEEDRVVRLVIATETPVARGPRLTEVLDCSPEAVDMSRLGTGRTPLCVDHDLRQHVGVVFDARVTGRTVVARGRLSRSASGEKELADIVDGIRTSVSVGYEILDVEMQRGPDGDVMRVTHWRPYEVSLAAVGLDPSATVSRSALNPDLPDELLDQLRARSMDMADNDNKPTPSVVVVNDRDAERRKQETRRQNHVRSVSTHFSVPDDVMQRALDAGTSEAEYSAEILKLVERRQADTRINPVDLTPREADSFSVGRWARAAIAGTLGRGSLELEANRAACRAYGIEERANTIFIPWGVLSKRATSVTTGTGQHIVPQQHGPFFDFLTATTQIGRVAMNLSGLRGDVDLPGGATLGTAAQYDQDGETADSESTFRNVRLSAKECRTRATLSRRLIENGGPGTDQIIERAIMDRIAEKVEQQSLYGDGDGEQCLGLANVSNISDGDLTGNAVSYSSLIGVKTSIATARALLRGPFSYITTPAVVGRALTTARFTNGGQSILTASGDGDHRIDGDLFLASHLVKTNSPSPTSPSELVAHDLFAACFDRAVVMATFGPGVEVTFNPWEDMVHNNVRVYGQLQWDLGVPVPEAIAYGDNILLS